MRIVTHSLHVNPINGTWIIGIFQVQDDSSADSSCGIKFTEIIFHIQSNNKILFQ